MPRIVFSHPASAAAVLAKSRIRETVRDDRLMSAPSS